MKRKTGFICLFIYRAHRGRLSNELFSTPSCSVLWTRMDLWESWDRWELVHIMLEMKENKEHVLRTFLQVSTHQNANSPYEHNNAHKFSFTIEWDSMFLISSLNLCWMTQKKSVFHSHSHSWSWWHHPLEIELSWRRRWGSCMFNDITFAQIKNKVGIYYQDVGTPWW